MKRKVSNGYVISVRQFFIINHMTMTRGIGGSVKRMKSVIL